jgi:flagellar basal-body rod modification protein FlgD
MATNMTTGLGPKAWDASPAPKEDMRNNVSTLTDAQKQKLGEEDIGAVLNKKADPNWQDPSKKVAGPGSSKLDKDAFFKLMLTQLKNQDPTNPLKNHEMAAQLAQFSTLEQMTNVNSTLTRMEGNAKQPESFQALNLIGKTVQGDSSKVTRSQFDLNHDFNFSLDKDATDAKIKVLNEKNEVVREYKFNDLKAGANKISWNGMNEKGIKQGVGDYSFQIEATGSNGMKLPVKTEFSGVISGLSFSSEGPVLQVGKQTIKMRDIRQITDSSLMSNDQKVKDLTSLDLKNDGQATQTGNTQAAATSLVTKEEDKSGQRVASPSTSELADVQMSPELMAKIQKEVK